MNLEITPELIVLGGVASTLIEVLRALLLDLNNYPRMRALWPILPSILGVPLVLLFPSAVPSATSCLIKAAHGFFCSAIWAVIYPILKNQITSKAKATIPNALPGTATSAAEGEKETPS